MSKKCENFLRALDTLCREHGVVVATSGYDSLQVWDMGAGEDPIYSVTEDMTEYPVHRLSDVRRRRENN